jgi:hypothetical protein
MKAVRLIILSIIVNEYHSHLSRGDVPARVAGTPGIEKPHIELPPPLQPSGGINPSTGNYRASK